MQAKNVRKTPRDTSSSTVASIARFGGVIQLLIFIVLADVLTRLLPVPIAHPIAALVVVLPSYWFAAKRRIGFAAFAAVSIVLATILGLMEYFFFGWQPIR